MPRHRDTQPTRPFSLGFRIRSRPQHPPTTDTAAPSSRPPPGQPDSRTARQPALAVCRQACVRARVCVRVFTSARAVRARSRFFCPFLSFSSVPHPSFRRGRGLYTGIGPSHSSPFRREPQPDALPCLCHRKCSATRNALRPRRLRCRPDQRHQWTWSPKRGHRSVPMVVLLHRQRHKSRRNIRLQSVRARWMQPAGQQRRRKEVVLLRFLPLKVAIRPTPR